MPVLAEAKKAEGRGTPLPDFVMVGDARLERAAFGSGDQENKLTFIFQYFPINNIKSAKSTAYQDQYSS